MNQVCAVPDVLQEVRSIYLVVHVQVRQLHEQLNATSSTLIWDDTARLHAARSNSLALEIVTQGHTWLPKNLLEDDWW